MKPIQHVIADSFPHWEIKAAPIGAGQCGWCKKESPQVFKDLPTAFLEYENLHIPADNAVVCRKCLTAISGLKPIRWGHMKITQTEAVMTHNPPILAEWLTQPTRSDEAIICNTNNQKRPLYNLRWGCLATSYDNGTYNWDSSDALLVNCVRRLREHGANEKDLYRDSPPAKLIKTSPNFQVTKNMYQRIKNWNRVKLECAILATRKPKPDADTNR